MLEDEVHDLPRGRIAWATFWKLCWEAYPGASAYELQTVTGEGTSPKLRRQREQCLRIEAAAGENAQAQGLRDRDLLLALQSGQLAYRVRAVLDDQHVSAWSAPMPVGEATRSESEVPERRAEVLTSLRKNCTLRSILVENPPD